MNKNAFNSDNVLFKLKKGNIGKIDMQIPLKSFLIGINNSIVININKVDIIVEINSNYEFFDYTNFDYKSKLINNFTDELLFKLKINENPKLNDTYMNRTLKYLIDNMKVNINEINIKLENGENSFCLYCQEISFDKRNMIIKNLNIYYGELKEFIISPITTNINFKYEDNKYLIDVKVNEINYRFTKEQYNSILKIFNMYNNYKNFYDNCYFLRKIQFNKPIERKLPLLKHYIKGIIFLIKERKYDVDLFNYYNNKEINKEIFIKSYKEYYYNKKITNELENIIRFTDDNFLLEWIKEDINNIYHYNNISSGFFGGLMNYFYSNAIQNIKVNSKLEEKEEKSEFNISISCNYIRFIFKHNSEESKIVIKDINHKLYLKEQDMKFLTNIKKIKIIYSNYINKSSFTNDIMINEENEKVEEELKVEYISNINEQCFKLNMISHSIFYNQNTMNFLYNFFFYADIDKIINTNKLISAINKHKFEQISTFKIDINIATHQLVFPYKTQDEQKLTFNLGDLRIYRNENFEIYVQNINVSFENNTKGSLIVKDFSFDINSTLDFKNIKINFSDIFFGSDILTIYNIINNSKQILSINSTEDIWKMKFKTKYIIFNNSIKRGFLLFKNMNKWNKYYSLLSGGYIYLFKDSTNEKPSFYIPLCYSEIDNEIKNDEGIFSIIIYNNHKNFKIGLNKKNDILNWKTLIQERINEIEKSVKDKEETQNEIPISIQLEDSIRIRNKLESQNENYLEHIKNCQKLIQKVNQIIKEKIYNFSFDISLSKISISLFKESNIFSFDLIQTGVKLKKNNLIFFIDISIDFFDIISNSIHFVKQREKLNQKLFQISIHLLDKNYQQILLKDEGKIIQKICHEKECLNYLNLNKKNKIDFQLLNDFIINIFTDEIKIICLSIYEIYNLLCIKKNNSNNSNNEKNILSNVTSTTSLQTIEFMDNNNQINIDFDIEFLDNKNNFVFLFYENSINIFELLIQIKHLIFSEGNLQVNFGDLILKNNDEINLINLSKSEDFIINYSFKNNNIIIDSKKNICIEIYYLILGNFIKYFYHNLNPLLQINQTKKEKYNIFKFKIVTKQIKLTLYDLYNFNIKYTISIESINLNNNFSDIKNLQIITYDKINQIEEERIIMSNISINSKKIQDKTIQYNLSEINFVLNKNDYDNIFNFISDISNNPLFGNEKNQDNIKKFFKKYFINTQKKLKSRKIINFEKIEFHFILNLRNSLIISLSNINFSLTQYNTELILKIIIDSIYASNNNITLINKIGDKNNPIDILFTQFYSTNSFICDSTFCDITFNLQYDLVYDLKNYFHDIRYRRYYHIKKIKKTINPINNFNIKFNCLLENLFFYIINRDNIFAFNINSFFSSYYDTKIIKNELEIHNYNLFIKKISNIENIDIIKILIKKSKKKYLINNCSFFLRMKYENLIQKNNLPLYQYSFNLQNIENATIVFNLDDLNNIINLVKDIYNYIVNPSNVNKNFLKYYYYEGENIYSTISFYSFNCILKIKNINIEFKNIFKITLNNNQFILLNSDKIGLQSNISIKYFNDILDIYETFIQNMKIDFSYIENKYSLNFPENININISNEFLSILNNLYDLFYLKRDENFIENDKFNIKLFNYSSDNIILNGEINLKNGQSYILNSLELSSLKFENNQVTFNSIKLSKMPKIIIYNKVYFMKQKNNYYFLSPILIHSFCSKNIYFVNSLKENILLHYQDVIGIEPELENLSLVLNYNYQNIITLNLEKITNTNKKNVFFDNFNVKLDKISIENQIINNISIFPNIIVHNCLDIPLTLYSIKTKNEILIKPCQTEELYINNNALDLFKLKFKQGNFEFYSEEVNLIQKQKKKSNTISLNVKNFEMLFKSFFDKNGVMNIYFYLEYFIINNTELNIYPFEYNLKFRDNKFNVDYYPILKFDKVELIIKENDKIYKIDSFSIEEKNYAFFKKINIEIEKTKLSLLIQRHLRYYKFDDILYVTDFLIISRIETNVNFSNHEKIAKFFNQNINIQKTKLYYGISINLSSIIFSLISTTKKERSEIAILSISKVFLSYRKEELKMKNLYPNNFYLNKINFFITSIQLDNMTKNSIYKIIFYNKKENKLISFNKNTGINISLNNNPNQTENKIPFIQMKIDFINNNYKYYFKEIIIQLLPFYLYLDSEFSSDLLIFIYSCYDIIKDKSIYSSNMKEIIESLSINLLKENNENDVSYYIDIISISPIYFYFNYKNFSNKLFTLLNFQNSFINTILDVFTNNTTHIDFAFKQLYLNNITSVNQDNLSNNNFFLQLYDFYYYNFLRQCIKVFFSVDILGDPYNLISHLSNGIKDFITLPIINLINGPKEFISNSLYGIKSLITNSLGGILNSAHKISNSLSKNILRLTNSEEYIKSRNSILLGNYNKNEYLNVFKIIFIGIKYGFTDIIYIPIIYYKKGGIIDLPLGIFLGITSLIAKPSSGIMDGFSIVTRNLSKDILNANKDNIENFVYNINNRKRYNRFIDLNNIIEDYSFKNEIFEELIKINEGDLKFRLNCNNLKFEKLFISKNKEKERDFTIIIFVQDIISTRKFIVIYKVKSDKKGKIFSFIPKNYYSTKKEGYIQFVNYIQISSILNVSSQNNKINILYYQKDRKRNSKIKLDISIRENILIQSIEFSENFTNFSVFEYLNSIINEEKK